MTACAPPPDEPDPAGIAEASRQLVDALNNDGVDQIMAALTGDHITMAPNEPALPLTVLRAWHENRIRESSLAISFKSEELITAGEWAFERWTSSLTRTPKDGGSPTRDTSKGIWIWKLQADGSWRLARSIWNSDNPLPEIQ
jgi:ketosteroid isomerase-like protein